jgi:D-alanyl-D-alanine carboxypeptidase
MRICSVGSACWPRAARTFASLVLTALLVAALAVPEAEARRRRHVKSDGYNPPYASIVYDVNSGRVLQATNADALRHPASVTKVMTLYMLFEQLETGRLKLSSELPVSREAASQAPSKLGLQPGETIQVEDAIKALVTKSANDVAVVVAEAIGGDEDRFGSMMTRKAHQLGMRRSHFENASGLPNPRQVTTARDLVTLGKAIQDRFPTYYKYFSTRSFTYEGRAHRNHNRLLGQVEGVDGIKTGYTRASGFNLLTSVKADGRHLITVVLGGKSARARDAQVASLVENHMDRAYAGRRQTARTIDVATRDDTGEEEEDSGAPTPPSRDLPAPRVALAAEQPAPPAAAPATAAPIALPAPPTRPRTAVIAETGARAANGGDPGLTRGRPLALAASGSTNIVRSATTPLALVGTTPRSPALRWVPGAEPANQPARPIAHGDSRLVPPGNVRYTNAIPDASPKPEDKQPLPVASAAGETLTEKTNKPAVAEEPKKEERLPSIAARAKIAAETPPPAPEVRTEPAVEPKVAATRTASIKTARVEPAPAAKPAAVPVRTGWIIQLAATDSESKARSILDSAKEKAGRTLKEAEPFTEAITKGGATLYRARFAGFDDSNDANSACKVLKRSGFACIAQKV